MSNEIVGSKSPTFPSEQRPSKRGYGQNGFTGASSDLPGEHTCSDFLPRCDLGAAVNSQMRTVSDKQIPAAFGQKGPARK